MWNPALQHCHLLATAHIPPLKPAGLQTKAASQRQRWFLLLHREDALPLSTSNHEQLALMTFYLIHSLKGILIVILPEGAQMIQALT